MSDRLAVNQQLNVNDQLTSGNGKVKLILQSDGNLVLYRTDNNRALWASNTVGKPITRAVMQGDGNFVVYDANNHAYWATGTWPHPGAWIVLQSDGNLVIYDGAMHPLWTSNTVTDFDPMHVETRDVHVGTGDWMNSSARMNAAGVITGSTHIWCTVALRGFTGSVCPVLLDANGLAIWPQSTEQAKHRYGVDGSAIPFTTHDRRVTWQNQVPADIVARAASMKLVSWHDPVNRLMPDIKIAGEIIPQVIAAIQTVASVVAAVA
jgi:hypothetical protein